MDNLGTYGTPTLFEASSAVQALSQKITPLYRPIELFGHAYTVKAAPGDNLAVHNALSQAPLNSVLVVTIGSETRHGFWGEVMTEAALARGIRGLVTDGAVRDSEAIRKKSFPVFCVGVAIPGTKKECAGSLDEPVMFGEVVVRPGDFLVGDDDGVVVIPRESADEVLEKARARAEKENAFIEKLRQGQLTLDLLDLR